MTDSNSHSAMFGLDGKDNPKAPASDLSGGTTDPHAGKGVLGGAGHPSGTSSSKANQDGQPTVSGQDPREQDSQVGGISQGTGSSDIPGAGGSILKPSQGSGDIAKH